MLVGAPARLIGGEEERDPGDVDRVELAFQALSLVDLLLCFRGHPQGELAFGHDPARCQGIHPDAVKSEEHTSELQSLMRTSYAVFCLKKKTTHTVQHGDYRPPD